MSDKKWNGCVKRSCFTQCSNYDKISRMIGCCVMGLGLTVVLLLTGCSEKRDPMTKIKDLEFTVQAEENIPQELKTVIDEKKQDAFKVTFHDNGYLYICTGYGEQANGGYSITVNELYLTENAIYFDTTLLGPDPSDAMENKKKAPSYPYVVIKTEFVDKPVVFN